MKLLEMKKKVLGLIEELNPNSEVLTDDPDIETKINDVINQIMFELVRFKKLPAYVEIEVKKGELIDYDAIEEAGQYIVYQIGKISGVEFQLKADGTIIKAMEDGTMEIEYYKYPESITAKTKDSYEFELPQDLLEMMPYGVAGDLLKSDISSDYGQFYSKRYEDMKQVLDPRYAMHSISIKGGYRI